MKRIALFAFALALGFASCKTLKKSTATSDYTTDNTSAQTTETTATPTKVFTVPDTKPAPVKKETVKIAEEKPIAIRKEQVSFTEQSDKTENEGNAYFVIVGSFSQLENAKNFRSTLLSEGFTPIILHSETGNYRVCVNSYKSEQEARARVSQIRQNYPQYADVWLLIKE